MKVLFLIVTFLCIIFTVQAQRNISHYTCSVSHKHLETTLNLTIDEPKEFEIGDWKMTGGVQSLGNLIIVSLSRTIEIMDATYKKGSQKAYPMNSRKLPVKLEHKFGGINDTFNMLCNPRDL
jgi:hypothetical protein